MEVSCRPHVPTAMILRETAASILCEPVCVHPELMGIFRRRDFISCLYLDFELHIVHYVA